MDLFRSYYKQTRLVSLVARSKRDKENIERAIDHRLAGRRVFLLWTYDGWEVL